MKGNREQQNPTDEQCPHCGMWFSRRGVIPHKRNCQFQDYDVMLQPLAGDGDEDVDEPGEGDPPEPEGGDPIDEPDDDEGPSPSPRRATDGGETGLGLEGPPEPPTPSPDVDDVDDDQDDVDEAACCSDPDRRALEPGTPIDLDEGGRVKADPGDELCGACGALVEADGRVRY